MVKIKTKKINRVELLQALREVAPGLSNKEIIEQSTSVIFDDDSIWTYNDTISINHNFKTGLKGAVKAEKFIKLLEKINQDEIEIIEDKGKLKIKTDKIKATIKIDQEIKLQPIKVPAKSSRKWEKLPNDFNEGISFASFSASKNMMRPELCCLWITENKIVTADSYRATIFNMQEEMKQTFLLRADAANQLAKYNPDAVITENGWVHFLNEEGTTFSVRTYTDIEYPEQVWNFFKVEGDEVELPDGFVDTVERAGILLTADFDLDQFVTLIISDNKIICKGEGSDGKIEEMNEIEYDGEEININVHPDLFVQILKHIQKVIIGKDRLLFESDKFKHSICLSIG